MTVLSSRLLVPGFALVALVVSPAFAGMHKCVGPDGKTTFSDRPCPRDAKKEAVSSYVGSAPASASASPVRPSGSAAYGSNRIPFPSTVCSLASWDERQAYIDQEAQKRSEDSKRPGRCEAERAKHPEGSPLWVACGRISVDLARGQITQDLNAYEAAYCGHYWRHGRKEEIKR